MPKRSDPSAGPSQRQQRVAELVRHALAEILARGDIQDPVLTSHVITIPEVRMSPDLKLATAYVMPLGGEDEARGDRGARAQQEARCATRWRAASTSNSRPTCASAATTASTRRRASTRCCAARRCSGIWPSR